MHQSQPLLLCLSSMCHPLGLTALLGRPLGSVAHMGHLLGPVAPAPYLLLVIYNL